MKMTTDETKEFITNLVNETKRKVLVYKLRTSSSGNGFKKRVKSI